MDYQPSSAVADDSDISALIHKLSTEAAAAAAATTALATVAQGSAPPPPPHRVPSSQDVILNPSARDFVPPAAAKARDSAATPAESLGTGPSGEASAADRLPASGSGEAQAQQKLPATQQAQAQQRQKTAAQEPLIPRPPASSSAGNLAAAGGRQAAAASMQQQQQQQRVAPSASEVAPVAAVSSSREGGLVSSELPPAAAARPPPIPMPSAVAPAAAAPWLQFDAVQFTVCNNTYLFNHYRRLPRFKIQEQDGFSLSCFLAEPHRIVVEQRTALVLYNMDTQCLEGLWHALSSAENEVEFAPLLLGGFSSEPEFHSLAPQVSFEHHSNGSTYLFTPH